MDIRMLKETCEATLHLIDEINYSKPTPKMLLTALLERTIELIDDGYTVDDIMFTTFELIGLVKNGSISENQAKKFKSDHYSETESLLNKINELRENQNRGNLEYVIELSDTGEKGGAKNKKHHFFKIVEKNDVKSNNESTKDSNSIRYEPVKLPKPNWFAKPFMSIELTSWRLFIYAAIPLISLLFGCALFVQSFITPSTSELLNFFTFYNNYYICR